MPSQIEPYQDCPAMRAELASFLADHLEDGPEEALWLERLAHWWDENPHAGDSPERGWVLREGRVLVGFLGLIPVRYAWQGQPVQALIATSWVVKPGCRNAALPMGMKLQRLAQSHLLLDSTPSLEVQALISRFGWVGEMRARRTLLPLGTVGRLFAKLAGELWPTLPKGRRITTEVGEVRSLARSWQENGRLEKWTCPASLRWYAAARMRQHQFLGVVDEDGRLTSCLWLTRRSRCGIHLWMLLESFSTEADDAELRALAAALVRREVRLLGPPAQLLSLLAFPQDPRWKDVRGLIRDEVLVCHFHALPAALKDTPKHTVMAEGDFGL